VRLGHPARVSESLREHTLDELAGRHPDAKQARKFYKDAHALFRKAGKWTRAKPEPGERANLRREARSLIDDARKLEDRAVERILDGASILCATLTGLNPEVLGNRAFDLVVIDEACQTAEPACWIAIGRAKRIVLAGDHCQLPPTVLSIDAARQGLSVSLMERLVARYGPLVTRRLRVQYRMHEAIAGFSSAEFYEGDLIADESVKAHRLCDLPGVATDPRTASPVRYVDTAGAGYDEEEVNDSRRNPQEAELVGMQVRALLDAGLSPEQIAVIAPYSAQVKLLRDALAVPGLEIDSVDGFQGREKEAVVFSMVRSNPEGEVGFLADVRRTNVALTRARRALIVVGDSATLANHPFYQKLLTYFEGIGAYGSVWEE
jgi:predicted DNA helicase